MFSSSYKCCLLGFSAVPPGPVAGSGGSWSDAHTLAWGRLQVHTFWWGARASSKTRANCSHSGNCRGSGVSMHSCGCGVLPRM